MGDNNNDATTKETIEQLVSNLPDEQRERYERLWNDVMSGAHTVLPVKPYVHYQEWGKLVATASGGPGFLGDALSAGGVTAAISTGLSRDDLERQLALLREARRHPLYPHPESPQWPTEYLDDDDDDDDDDDGLRLSHDEQMRWWEQAWKETLAGKRELLVRTKLSPTPKPIAREVIPDADADAAVSYSCDLDRFCDGDDRIQLREHLSTALSLILRMARGYDWRPAEVDAFESACRDAGIEVRATEPSAKKSADTDREL